MSAYHKHYALPVGKMVQEYRIIEILGSGGFGIVYKAENKYFSEIVALKEFLPVNLAYRDARNSKVFPLSPESEKAYQWTRHKFLQEAKTLRELGHPRQHPNIVKVRQFIEANDTAYMVMDFEEGLPLSEILSKQGTLEEKNIKAILDALLDGLERVHKALIWHRDIKPSNILIRPDSTPVLIDFGAARRDISDADQSVITTLTPSYAAVEQAFPIGRQGPWTDIYSLGATLYRAVTGIKPIPVNERLQGKAYISAAAAAKRKYSPGFLSAIDAALGLYPDQRPQSINQWKTLFASQKTAATLPSAPPPAIEADNEKTEINFAAENSGKTDFPKNRAHFLKKRKFHILLLALLSALLIGKGFQEMQPSRLPVVPPDLQTQTEKKSVPRDTAPPPFAQIYIESLPNGARVFINGEFKGRTPVKADVGAGPQSLYLGLKGYYDWKADLLIEEKGEIPLRISLLKK